MVTETLCSYTFLIYNLQQSPGVFFMKGFWNYENTWRIKNYSTLKIPGWNDSWKWNSAQPALLQYGGQWHKSFLMSCSWEGLRRKKKCVQKDFHSQRQHFIIKPPNYACHFCNGSCMWCRQRRFWQTRILPPIVSVRKKKLYVKGSDVFDIK